MSGVLQLLLAGKNPNAIVRGFTSTSGTGTSRSVSTPAGAAIGDTLVVFQLRTSTSFTGSGPGGWTKDANVSGLFFDVYRLKLTAAPDASYTFNTSGSVQTHLQMVCVASADFVDSHYDAVGAALDNSITVTFGDYLLLWYGANSSASVTHSLPSGYTDLEYDSNASDASYRLCYAQAANTTTVSASSTSSSSASDAILVCLKFAP